MSGVRGGYAMLCARFAAQPSDVCGSECVFFGRPFSRTLELCAVPFGTRLICFNYPALTCRATGCSVPVRQAQGRLYGTGCHAIQRALRPLSIGWPIDSAVEIHFRGKPPHRRSTTVRSVEKLRGDRQTLSGRAEAAKEQVVDFRRERSLTARRLVRNRARKRIHSTLTCLRQLVCSRGQRQSKGFAHRSRPTYAGANVGHPCGAVGPAKGLRGRAEVSHPAVVAGREPKISSPLDCGLLLSPLAACWALRGRGGGPAGRWRTGHGGMRCDNAAPAVLPVVQWPASGCPPGSKHPPPQIAARGRP
jgi:hypothetical protein